MSAADDRAARLDFLVEQLSGRADEVVRQMALELVDLPDEELFGAIEVRLRALALKLSHQAQQVAADSKKKEDM